MRAVRIAILVCFLSLWGFAPAAAQLSQLEFDELINKAQRASRLKMKQAGQRSRLKVPEKPEKLEEVYESTDRMRVKIGAGVKIPLPLEGQDDSGYTILPPNLKGPRTDANNAIAITSKSWTKTESEQCWVLHAKESVKDKSAAVQEILERFSGSRDYYDGLLSAFCAPECENQSGKPYVSGISIVDAFGGEFKIISEGNNCSYQLTKSTGKRWPIYQIDKLVCNCL